MPLELVNPKVQEPVKGLVPFEESITPGTGVTIPTYTKDVALPEKKFYVSSPEQRSAWSNEGKVGWWEYAKETKGKDLYYGDIIETAGLGMLIGRLKKNDYKDEAGLKSDQQKLTDWMMRQEELESKGLTWGANVYKITANIPTFAAEMYLTGGLATATRKGVRIGARKLATKLGGKIAGEVAEKVAKKGALGLAKKAAAVLGTEAAVGLARTTVMPHRYLAAYGERRLNDHIAITDKGISIVEESKESPVKAFTKAYGDVFVEYFSETLGGTLLKPAGGVVGRSILAKLPKGASAAFIKVAKAIQKITPKGKAIDLVTKGGFNGILEEYGEERLGSLFRIALGLDERDMPTLDKLQEAIFPGWEQAATEIGAFALWGGGSFASQKVMDYYGSKGKPVDEIDKIVSNMTQLEKEALVEEIEDRKATVEALTPEQRAEIEGKAEEMPIEAPKEAVTEPEVVKEPIVEPISKDNIVKAKQAISNRGLKGDNLLDVEDRIDEVLANDKTAEIDNKGFITLYHRTTPENATSIAKSGKMKKKETSLFFGTKPEGQIEGYGDAVIQVKVPIESTEINDIFRDEVHLIIPGKNLKDVQIKADIWNKAQGTESLSPEDTKEFNTVYTPSERLTEKTDITEEKKASEYALTNGEAILADYEKNFGNEVSTDKMRDYFRPIGFTGDNSAVYHEPASALKKIYEKRVLAKAKEDGKLDVLWTAGGSGAGKTGTLDRMGAFKKTLGYILDSNLSDSKKAIKDIQKLMDQGFTPNVFYVYRDPVDAWNGGVMRRIISGSDIRVVPLSNHLELHEGSLETVMAIFDKFGDKINLTLIDNSHGYKKEVETSIAKLKKISYNLSEIRKEIEDDTIKLYQEGLISAKMVEGSLERKLTDKERSSVSKSGEVYREFNKTKSKESISKDKRRDPTRQAKLTASQKAEAKVKDFKARTDEINRLQEEREELTRLTKAISGKKLNDVLRTDIAEEGFHFETVEDFKETVKEARLRLKEIKTEIEIVKPALITKRESTLARDKLANIKSGIREGTVKTKKDVSKIQNELIYLVNKQSALEAKDKAKFITSIKNVQSVQQLNKARNSIKERIMSLEEKADVVRIDSLIKRELKFTKPVKKGQKKIEKYDYTTSKLFKELRGFTNLTKTKAQEILDSLPEETTKEIDLIKKRFLSLKANGKEASIDIYDKVLEDLQKMKELGEAVKTEDELFNRINREDLVDQALESLEKIKADKKTIKTKIGNVYRKGFSNIYSMINSTFGKKIAETYDPQLSENRRDTSTYFVTKAVGEQVSKIYEEKHVPNILESMSKNEYKITDFQNLETELTKLHLIDIYNSIKNDKVRARYYDAFGENQVQNLMGELTNKDIDFADFLQESVQDYRKILNQRNIEITGRDLGFVENYWPATSEHQPDIYDDIRMQGETPSALKERARGKVIPTPTNAWFKTQKHIAQSEHVDKLSRDYETLKRLFTERRVKNKVSEKFGEDVYDVLIDQVDNLSLNAQTKKIDQVSKWFRGAINNWVTAKIAFNPSTLVRQLMSTGNYAENMKSAEWVKGFFEGVANPKKTFDFMWKNAPFLEARFNRGYSEAIKDAISGAEKLSAKKGSWSKFLSVFARSGDVTAIIYGGFPLVQSELAKGKTLEEAMRVFELATLKAQQSGLSSSLSQYQNSRSPWARLFLAFKNTSNQYSRKMADSVISFQNGDISKEEFAKTMAIYAVIQPTLYVLSGILVKETFKGIGAAIFGGYDDDDELVEKIFDGVLTQLVVNPVNAIPVIDDIVNFAMRRATGQNAWKVMSTPFLDDLSTGIQKVFKEEPSASDYLSFASSILEPATALPVNTFLRYYEYITGEKLGE